MMDENLDNPGRQELDAWTKKHLNAAVRKLMNLNAIDSFIVEAKPAWVLPFQILIGKIRAQGQSMDFEWFICGEVPTDFLESTVASTPKEAARHFAMKWQLEAAKHQDHSEQKEPVPELRNQDSQLVDKAEALYALTDDERLWQPPDNL